MEASTDRLIAFNERGESICNAINWLVRNFNISLEYFSSAGPCEIKRLTPVRDGSIMLECRGGGTIIVPHFEPLILTPAKAYYEWKYPVREATVHLQQEKVEEASS